MPNVRTAFITNDDGDGGSSLYVVTANWVIRCSGNTSRGRTATTFIRKRPVEYVLANAQTTQNPMVGAFPREGGHDGHKIAAILDMATLEQIQEPAQWRSANGVSWAKAVAEVDAALAYARETQYERASRKVDRTAFARDPA
jgi:hypothetical protein